MTLFARIIFSGIVLGAVLPACTPPDPNETRTVTIGRPDLRDRQVQKLYDWRDTRQVDSLIAYLQYPEPSLRYLAALAFASVRDSAAIDALVPLLADPVEEVRVAAAFALGQIGSARAEKPLTDAFRADDSLSRDQRFNAAVLEAVGKCGTAASLKHIAAVGTYLPTDTLLLVGQCRALYRFGLRGITDRAGTDLAVGYVANTRIPRPARLLAAHYLARAKDLAPDSAQATQMAAAFVRSTDPDVRMALARGLGRSRTGPAFAILSKVIDSERDWRVTCDIIRAFAGHPNYDTLRALIIPRTLDTNRHVARTAAEFFIANGQARDGDYYWRVARENPGLPWEARVALYHASNRWLSGKTEPESKDFVNFRLKEMYQQASNPYERAACLKGLAEFGWQYRWIHDKGFRDGHPAVKTAAVEAIRTIASMPSFYTFFGEGARGVRRELYAYLREAVGTGDPGMIAEAAPAFESKPLGLRELRDSLRLPDFYRTLGALKMPRDYEAHAALSKAIAFFEGRPAPAATRPAHNHPINWERLNVVSEKTEVTLQTSRGAVVLELYPHWAPGTVANFLELASTGFFNGKAFHRVVPNFVVQGGDPRGDGYGAQDYSLRTEIGLAWYDDEGYVGMASAGADTEGTQYFFTHSPTPHLDGQYTIFGRVRRGIDVVMKLQMGDVVEKATIQY